MTLFLSFFGLVVIASVGLACHQEYRDFRHEGDMSRSGRMTDAKKCCPPGLN
jgi:hypothetical protein